MSCGGPDERVPPEAQKCSPPYVPPHAGGNAFFLPACGKGWGGAEPPEGHACRARENMMDDQTLFGGPDKQVPPKLEGHACRARRNRMGCQRVFHGPDERVPPRGGPDKQVPPSPGHGPAAYGFCWHTPHVLRIFSCKKLDGRAHPQDNRQRPSSLLACLFQREVSYGADHSGQE